MFWWHFIYIIWCIHSNKSLVYIHIAKKYFFLNIHSYYRSAKHCMMLKCQTESHHCIEILIIFHNIIPLIQLQLKRTTLKTLFCRSFLIRYLFVIVTLSKKCKITHCVRMFAHSKSTEDCNSGKLNGHWRSLSSYLHTELWLVYLSDI